MDLVEILLVKSWKQHYGWKVGLVDVGDWQVFSCALAVTMVM